MVTFHTMYNAYSLDQIDVQVLDTCGACINDDIPVCDGVGWWRGVVTVAGSEMGGVPGGSVREERGGKRPGEARNKVWPSHPLHYKFKQQSCVLSAAVPCGEYESTIFHCKFSIPLCQHSHTPPNPTGELLVLQHLLSSPFIPTRPYSIHTCSSTSVAAYLVFWVSAYLIYCTYPYILPYILCVYTLKLE